MPRTPYLPPGTLREALAYPSHVARFGAQAYSSALVRLGLERLEPLLDEPRRWDRVVSEDEQQRLAFASLVLHAPRWVLIDEVLDSLDDDSLQRVIDVLAGDLKRTGIIYIGRAETNYPLFSRTLHLIKDPATRRLRRNAVAPAQTATAAA
jgi:putative ATP-binding cassette transporter